MTYQATSAATTFTEPSSAARYAIHPLRATFLDQDTEGAFRESEAASTRQHLRIAPTLWAVLVMPFAFPDYAALGGSGEAFRTLFAMRVGTASLVVGFTLLTFWRPELCENHPAIAALQAAGISGFFLIYFTRPEVAAFNIGTTLVMIIGIYLLLPNLLTWGTAIAAYLAIGSLLSIWIVLGLDLAQVVSIAVVLCLPIATGAVVAHRLQSLRRRQFALLAQAQAINTELAEEVNWRRRLESELERQASTDLLTGLYNRRGYEPLLQREFERVRRHGGHLAIALLDLDHFKAFNDQYGHAAGDDVLRFVADQWADQLRAMDIIGRLGGEEFIVIMPDTAMESAMEAMQRLCRRTAETPVPIPGGAAPISVTIGVTTFHSADPSVLELIRRADQAMYTGKREGRNRVACQAADPP